MIREATIADSQTLAAIFDHYVANTVVTFELAAPTAGEWESRVRLAAESGFPFIVAEVEELVVGFAYASSWRPKPAYNGTVEDSVYLAPGQVGKGLGRALLVDLLARCADAGFREVIAVIADAGNPASVALHQSLGFTEVGLLKRVGFKHGQWVDTLLMQMNLDAETSKD